MLYKLHGTGASRKCSSRMAPINTIKPIRTNNQRKVSRAPLCFTQVGEDQVDPCSERRRAGRVGHDRVRVSHCPWAADAACIVELPGNRLLPNQTTQTRTDDTSSQMGLPTAAASTWVRGGSQPPSSHHAKNCN